MNLPFLWGFDRSWMNYSPFCFLGDQWVKCVRLKHICSVFGIFPSYTPCFFKNIILELKTLREARTLWCWGNSDPLDHIHSCLHLAALLPKVTLPVPSENPNLLNGHEWNTPCAWMWGRGLQSHGSSLERRRLFLGDHLDALHVMCHVLLRGALLPLLHNKPKVLLCLQPVQGLQSLVIASVCVFLSICVPPAHSEWVFSKGNFLPDKQSCSVIQQEGCGG